MERQQRIEEINQLREEISLLRHKLEQCQRKLLVYHEIRLNKSEGNMLSRFWRMITTEPDW
jgi:hypothetical protein